MRIRSHQRRRSRRGGTVALTIALCLPVLLGAAAFVLDGGMLMAERRRAQGIADASSHAAACSLYKNFASDGGGDPNGKARAAALSIASANGYANNGNATVNVNIPPKSGTFAGKAGYAEAIVQYDHPRYFSAIFGSGTIPVTARAVARVAIQSKASVIVLDPSAAGALTLTGSARINAESAIQVNSSNAGAVNASNGAYATGQINIAGNYSIPNWATWNTFFSKPPRTNQSATADPLAALPTPPSNGPSKGSVYTGNGKYEYLSPGVYNSLSINYPGATLAPGTYYIKSGGLTIANGATVTGSGVMFYLDNSGGSVNFQGGGQITLSPPTSGTYADILLFQDRNNTRTVNIANGATTTITGTIYAAGAEVSIAGGTQNSQYGSQFISKRLTISNGASILMKNSTISGGSVGRPELVQAGND